MAVLLLLSYFLFKTFLQYNVLTLPVHVPSSYCFQGLRNLTPVQPLQEVNRLAVP
jgi:hypothetical protein